MTPRRKSKLSPVARETRASERRRITDDDVKAAVDVIHRDYWQDVHGIGDESKDAIENGEITDDGGFRERVHQEVDGSQRVIYTFQSKLGMLVTNNPDAYEEAFGTAPVEGDQINWAAMMFASMEADLLAYIGDVGFDD